MPINISNSKNRDAVVALEGLRPNRAVRYVEKSGRAIKTQKVLKADAGRDLSELLKKHKKIEKVATALVKSDPEVDIELAGMFLVDTSRVYVAKEGIVHTVEEFEIRKDPEGNVVDRRPRHKEPQNINADTPLRWTGKFVKKSEAVKSFVLTNKKQLVHVNGLTFDFLFDIAKELEKRDSLLLLRGGEKGNKPVILNRGGRAYNAFLEGRTKGDSYCLILHLSNMELKKPKEVPVAEH